jgi:hypothetical protein
VQCTEHAGGLVARYVAEEVVVGGGCVDGHRLGGPDREVDVDAENAHIERDIGSIVWVGDVWRTLPRTGSVSRRVGRGSLRRETTAKVGIAMKRPLAGWDNACIHTELGILMRLLGPLSQVLDATRAR